MVDSATFMRASPVVCLGKNPNSVVNTMTLYATRRPEPLCECWCDPKWPTARPSWCLCPKVLLLIHREEPLALPAAELIVGHSVHSFPLRKQLPVGSATDGPQPRNAPASQRNSDCLQRCVPLCKQSARVQGARSEPAGVFSGEPRSRWQCGI